MLCLLGLFVNSTDRTLIMLEAQTQWYKPNPLSIGWHVGSESMPFCFLLLVLNAPEVWNFIGAVGFTLCGAVGYVANNSTGAAYQSALSTFWGGWAFLIGSVIQWFEAVNALNQQRSCRV
jgi:hypothetical protein